MEIVQDLVIGSLGGLAVRQLRKALLGPPSCPNAEQLDIAERMQRLETGLEALLAAQAQQQQQQQQPQQQLLLGAAAAEAEAGTVREGSRKRRSPAPSARGEASKRPRKAVAPLVPQPSPQSSSSDESTSSSSSSSSEDSRSSEDSSSEESSSGEDSQEEAPPPGDAEDLSPRLPGESTSEDSSSSEDSEELAPQSGDEGVRWPLVLSEPSAGGSPHPLPPGENPDEDYESEDRDHPPLLPEEREELGLPPLLPEEMEELGLNPFLRQGRVSDSAAQAGLGWDEGAEGAGGDSEAGVTGAGVEAVRPSQSTQLMESEADVDDAPAAVEVGEAAESLSSPLPQPSDMGVGAGDGELEGGTPYAHITALRPTQEVAEDEMEKLAAEGCPLDEVLPHLLPPEDPIAGIALEPALDAPCHNGPPSPSQEGATPARLRAVPSIKKRPPGIAGRLGSWVASLNPFRKATPQVKEKNTAADPPVLAPPAAEVTLPDPPPAIMQPEGVQAESPAPSTAPMQPEPPLTEMAAPSPAASESEPLLAEMPAPPTIAAEPKTPPAETTPAEDEEEGPPHSQRAAEDPNPTPSVHTPTRCDSDLEADEEVSGGLPGGRSPSPPPHTPTLGQGGSVPSAAEEGGAATAAQPTPGSSKDAPGPRAGVEWGLGQQQYASPDASMGGEHHMERGSALARQYFPRLSQMLLQAETGAAEVAATARAAARDRALPTSPVVIGGLGWSRALHNFPASTAPLPANTAPRVSPLPRAQHLPTTPHRPNLPLNHQLFREGVRQFLVARRANQTPQRAAPSPRSGSTNLASTPNPSPLPRFQPDTGVPTFGSPSTEGWLGGASTLSGEYRAAVASTAALEAQWAAVTGASPASPAPAEATPHARPASPACTPLNPFRTQPSPASTELQRSPEPHVDGPGSPDGSSPYTPSSHRYTPVSPDYRVSSPVFGQGSPGYMPTSPGSPGSPAYSPVSPGCSPTSPAYSPTQGDFPASPGYPPTSPAYSPRSPAFAPMEQADSPRSPEYHPAVRAGAAASPEHISDSPSYAPTEPSYHLASPGYVPTSPPFSPGSPRTTPSSPAYDPASRIDNLSEFSEPPSPKRLGAQGVALGFQVSSPTPTQVSRDLSELLGQELMSSPLPGRASSAWAGGAAAAGLGGEDDDEQPRWERRGRGRSPTRRPAAKFPSTSPSPSPRATRRPSQPRASLPFQSLFGPGRATVNPFEVDRALRQEARPQARPFDGGRTISMDRDEEYAALRASLEGEANKRALRLAARKPVWSTSTDESGDEGMQSPSPTVGRTQRQVKIFSSHRQRISTPEVIRNASDSDSDDSNSDGDSDSDDDSAKASEHSPSVSVELPQPARSPPYSPRELPHDLWLCPSTGTRSPSTGTRSQSRSPTHRHRRTLTPSGGLRPSPDRFGRTPSPGYTTNSSQPSSRTRTPVPSGAGRERSRERSRSRTVDMRDRGAWGAHRSPAVAAPIGAGRGGRFSGEGMHPIIAAQMGLFPEEERDFAHGQGAAEEGRAQARIERTASPPPRVERTASPPPRIQRTASPPHTERTASPPNPLHEAMDIDEVVGDDTAKEDGEAGAGLRKSTPTTIEFTDSDEDEDEDMDAPASQRASSPVHAGLGGRRGRKLPASFNTGRDQSPAGPSNPWRHRSPTLSPRGSGRRNRRKPYKANSGHLVGGVVKNAVRMGLSFANDVTNNLLGQALGAAAMATGAGSAAGEPGSPTSESSGEEGPLTDGEPDVAFVGERSGPSDPVQDFPSWEKEFEAGRKAVAAARAKAKTWATGVFAEEGEDVVDLTH